MKKKVICFLTLAVFLLLACTMLSTKIEQEMLTQVVVKEVKPKPAGRSMVALPLWSVYCDDPDTDLELMSLLQKEEGLAPEKLHVYHVEPGVGWENGLRLREVEQGSYTIDVLAGYVAGFDEGKGWKFVNFSSRPPVDGQQVQITSPKAKSRDRYLVVYPDRVPQLPRELNGMSIAAMTRNALLLEAEDAPQPFIRDRAGRQLESLNIPGCRIYSVDTAEQFWSCLPAISGVAVILFAAVVIWVQSLFLLKNHRENRWWLAVDVLLGVGLLWGLWRLLGQIDLPSDLLPAENILQWSHYTEEFSQIMSALSTTRGNLFDSMRHLGRTGQQTINLALRMTAQVKKIAIFGTILPLLWGILPLLVRVCFTKKNSMQH